jgi:hypothetical protein
MKDDLGYLVMTFLLIAAAIAAIVIAAQPFQSWVCDNKWQQTAHRYVWFGGCQVMTPEGWVPADNYRVLD